MARYNKYKLIGPRAIRRAKAKTEKAKERQLSEICLRKDKRHQSETVKRMCKRWKEQQGA